MMLEHLQTKEEADQAEKALSKELEKLSLEQRERILFDIHGVRENKIEDEQETINEKLQEVQRELLLLIKNKKAIAYKRAWHLNRTFVENASFRKLFLRAEDYDPKKAAQRIALHFQVKQELFVRNQNEGDEILVRDVTWEDLDQEDRRMAETGFFQVGSQRDVAGRIVVFGTSSLYEPHWSPDATNRAVWYIFMSAMRTDVHMQTKGIVGVAVTLQGNVTPMHVMRAVVRVRSSLPIATTAMHQCYDSLAFHLAAVGMRLVMYAMKPEISHRFRCHYGNLKQVAFELQTFGIPMETSPYAKLLREMENNSNTSINVKEGVSVGWHLQWLLAIRKSETPRSPVSDGTHQLNDDSICIIPRRFDVLFGRSNLAWEHPGTLRCHHLVRMHRETYEQATKREKTQIADQIMKAIRASDGRFLRWEAGDKSASGANSGGSWVVVDDKVARGKVSHMFRNLRKTTSDSMDTSSEGTGEGTPVFNGAEKVPYQFVAPEVGHDGPRQKRKQ